MSQPASTPREQLRRVAIALCGSTALVVLIATLLPRAYLVNDDPGFVLYLRLGAYTPWMSPLLNRVLVSAYQLAPDLPWYGLYLYGLIIATGAVLIHTCMELIDSRHGLGSIATRIGAVMIVASHIILAVGVTWTTVSISALGTAMVAFVAHLQTCQSTGTRASPLRALIYGLVFAAGFALRQAAIFAMVAALLPLLCWVGVHFVRKRYLPRPAAVIAFLAPLVIVFVMQSRIPQSPGAEYEEFNTVRGRISEAAAFGNLDKRAPELLERAGWTVDEYRDFSNWLLADDTEFTLEKVRRLADTGGIPTSVGLAESFAVLRGIAVHSAASVWLFLSSVAGAILLVWLGVVDRRRVLWFSIGNLVFLTLVPVAMAAISRFPQRIALSFYTVAAFGMFVFLVGEIANRAPTETRPSRSAIGLLLISLFMFVWARGVIAWSDRDSWRYHTTLREFADRVNARHGIIMVAVGITEMDPLLADPRGYDALPSGWGTFTAPWFEYIHRFGIQSGSELLHKMIDNPDAYLVATPYGHEGFEEWIRRRVGNPAIRLSLVDSAAGMPSALRSELYRLVTTPLVRGSEEWDLLARNQAAYTAELDGPPDVTGRTFRSVAFAAPHEQHVSSFLHPATAIVVAPVDGGIRCTASAAPSDHCASPGEGAEHAGIRVPVHGLSAARFDLTLIDSENILGVYVSAQTESDRSIRWRWDLDPVSQQFGFAGPVTLVPGFRARRFELADSTANPRDIRDLHVFIAVKPGTHAGFELRHLEVSEP